VIAINYNLPPSVRNQLKNVMIISLIPGPNQPTDINSFMLPFVRETRKLAKGVKTFNALTQDTFWLRAYFIRGFGDMVAMEKAMYMKGHNGKLSCCHCYIIGVTDPYSKKTTNYCPLHVPKDAQKEAKRKLQPAELLLACEPGADPRHLSL
jgi:hypothetical protein